MSNEDYNKLIELCPDDLEEKEDILFNAYYSIGNNYCFMLQMKKAQPFF